MLNWQHLLDGMIHPSITKTFLRSPLFRYRALAQCWFHRRKRLVSSSQHIYVIWWLNIFVRWERNYKKKMPDCGGEFLNFLPAQLTKTFFLSPVVKEELISEIKKLNPRKSCGSDDIRAKVIQLCPMIFADNLAKIYNHSKAICDYPSKLKIAKVIALFKNGEKSNPNNYGPISLLSCSNKLFEKLLCERLVKFIERNQILFNYQSGSESYTPQHWLWLSLQTISYDTSMKATIV